MSSRLVAWSASSRRGAAATVANPDPTLAARPPSPCDTTQAPAGARATNCCASRAGAAQGGARARAGTAAGKTWGRHPAPRWRCRGSRCTCTHRLPRRHLQSNGRLGRRSASAGKVVTMCHSTSVPSGRWRRRRSGTVRWKRRGRRRSGGQRRRPRRGLWGIETRHDCCNRPRRSRYVPCGSGALHSCEAAADRCGGLLGVLGVPTVTRPRARRGREGG